MKKLIALSLAAAAAILTLTACAEKEKPSDQLPGNLSGYSYTETTEKTDFVKLETEDGGIILIELYPDVAPITVENFKKLVSEKYYDGLIFHRVIKGFMIQGGEGKHTDSIKGEFAQNGVKNDLRHERGVISMARTNDMNSASSQFFICHTTEQCKHLDGLYAGFGKVIAGMDVVDRIAETPTDSRNRPLTEQKIRSIRFVTVEPASGGTMPSDDQSGEA